MTTVVSVDVTDISGELQTDLQHNILKTRLASTGERVDVAATNGACCLFIALNSLVLISFLLVEQTWRVSWTRPLLLEEPTTVARAMVVLNQRVDAARIARTSGKRILIVVGVSATPTRLSRYTVDSIFIPYVLYKT